MIDKVITYINTQISDLNIFKDVKGLCEFVEQEESSEYSTTIIKFPAYYNGKGQLLNVTDYDFRNGVIFHLKNGDVTSEQLESMRSETKFLKYTFPIKLVCMHLKQTIDDSAYTPDKFGLNLMSKVNQLSINPLRSILKANKIYVNANSYTTDKDALDDIFQNVEIVFRQELVIVTLDYQIFVEAYQKCFNPYTC